MRVLLSALMVTCGCGASLSTVDVTSLHQAQEADVNIYEMPTDGGSPARALARSSYCAVDSVLQRDDAGSFPTPDITCQKAKP